MTSRIHGYTADIALPDGEFARVRIDSLTDEDVDSFIERWYSIQIPENERLRG